MYGSYRENLLEFMAFWYIMQENIVLERVNTEPLDIRVTLTALWLLNCSLFGTEWNKCPHWIWIIRWYYYNTWQCKLRKLNNQINFETCFSYGNLHKIADFFTKIRVCCRSPFCNKDELSSKLLLWMPSCWPRRPAGPSKWVLGQLIAGSENEIQKWPG